MRTIIYRTKEQKLQFLKSDGKWGDGLDPDGIQDIGLFSRDEAAWISTEFKYHDDPAVHEWQYYFIPAVRAKEA